MEIYTGQPTLVTVAMPVGFDQVTVEIFDFNGSRVSYGDPSSSTSTSVTFAVPYRAVKIDTTLSVSIDFTIDSERENITQEIDVITPILPLDEIKSILSNDPTSISDDRAKDLERRVRIAIQTFTGEVFASYKGTVTVYGNNDTGLKLPRRLISLDSVQFNGQTATAMTDYTYLVKADGRYLEAPTPLFWDIKDAPPDPVLDVYDYYAGGPISAPSLRSWNNFSSQIAYEVTGTFGYETIPYDVVQAARYLVNDYGCNESLYRDRYLAAISAADWRFEYRDDAFQGTGNVQADQILSQYRQTGMSVI